MSESIFQASWCQSYGSCLCSKNVILLILSCLYTIGLLQALDWCILHPSPKWWNSEAFLCWCNCVYARVVAWYIHPLLFLNKTPNVCQHQQLAFNVWVQSKDSYLRGNSHGKYSRIWRVSERTWCGEEGEKKKPVTPRMLKCEEREGWRCGAGEGGAR